MDDLVEREAERMAEIITVVESIIELSGEMYLLSNDKADLALNHLNEQILSNANEFKKLVYGVPTNE